MNIYYRRGGIGQNFQKLKWYPMPFKNFVEVTHQNMSLLRIPDTYEAKIAKICNFWTF